MLTWKMGVGAREVMLSPRTIYIYILFLYINSYVPAFQACCFYKIFMTEQTFNFQGYDIHYYSRINIRHLVGSYTEIPILNRMQKSYQCFTDTCYNTSCANQEWYYSVIHYLLCIFYFLWFSPLARSLFCCFYLF